MLSAPDAVSRTVLPSQQSGAIAEVTADAYEPPIATTLSTSISLCAALTAASGLLWSSSMTIWIGRPRTPPAELISVSAILAACPIVAPNWLVAPVRGMMSPIRIGSPCCAQERERLDESMSPPTPRPERRKFLLSMFDMFNSSPFVNGCNSNPMRDRRCGAPQKQVSDFVVLEDHAGGVVPNLPSGHENDAARAVLEGEKRVLLHHEDRQSARCELADQDEDVFG